MLKKNVTEIKQPKLYDPFKTLLGNWVEDRAKWHEEVYKHTTTYSNFFTQPPIDPNRQNLYWDQKLYNERNNIIPQKGRFEGSFNFFNNYSTTYDLCFNHLPKNLKHCKIRTPPRVDQRKTLERANDYLYSFGNITKYGLVDYSKRKWEYEDSGKHYSTHYQETFVAPDIEDYRFKRCASSITNSSILDSTNNFYQRLKLRDQGISNVRGFSSCCASK